jgi:hypothetical protein
MTTATTDHRMTITRDFLWTDLDCSCGELAVGYLGDVTREELDAKFDAHLEKTER